MELKLYNTLTRKNEVFTPLDPKNVRMYVCGPTVYDYAHIGNARPVIVFDVLFRLLRHIYGPDHVTYVRNVTDIDDKIITRAHELQGERNVPIFEIVRELTGKTYRQFHEDVSALGVLPPTHEPRATEHIPQMIAMIEKLIAAGHAYAADGHVLYDVSSKPDYGKLANRSLDEMIAGARIDVAPYKKGPMDFVLWKPSDAATPGWDSPWGRGRPGWHIECSAMADDLLWEKAKGGLSESGLAHAHEFDIHGGGIDLVFPHHENEIAQSEGAHHGHPLARYWMHNGFLQVEGEKMSKSLGNFVTIRELLKTDKFGGRSWPGPVLRLAMLMTHYRQPIDWSVQRLREALIIAERAYVCAQLSKAEEAFPEEYIDALVDDLNTPKAITILQAYVTKAHQGDTMAKHAVRSMLRFSGVSFRRFTKAHLTPDVEAMRAIALRNLARERKDYAEADRIRDELLEKGIVLKDGPSGTTWELKR